MRESDIIRLFQSEEDGLDDCAVLPHATGTPGATDLVTTDSLVEGTHFRRDWSSPEEVARKLFQANLSDLGASGGRPEWGLLNLGLPIRHDDDWVRAFAGALRDEFQNFSCRLIGGDTFRAPGIYLGLTLGGPAPRVLTRSGGRPGDALYLTGEIGGALAGYRILTGDRPFDPEDDTARRARDRHLRPEARTAWAREITGRAGVRAGMDLSDGIHSDAQHLARASQLQLRIELSALPVPAEYVERGWITLEESLVSGEEYELLFLGEPDLRFDFPCRVIGSAEAGPPTLSFTRDGAEIRPRETRGPGDSGPGFEHFSGNAD